MGKSQKDGAEIASLQSFATMLIKMNPHSQTREYTTPCKKHFRDVFSKWTIERTVRQIKKQVNKDLDESNKTGNILLDSVLDNRSYMKTKKKKQPRQVQIFSPISQFDDTNDSDLSPVSQPRNFIGGIQDLMDIKFPCPIKYKSDCNSTNQGLSQFADDTVVSEFPSEEQFLDQCIKQTNTIDDIVKNNQTNEQYELPPQNMASLEYLRQLDLSLQKGTDLLIDSLKMYMKHMKHPDDAVCHTLALVASKVDVDAFLKSWKLVPAGIRGFVLPLGAPMCHINGLDLRLQMSALAALFVTYSTAFSFCEPYMVWYFIELELKGFRDVDCSVMINQLNHIQQVEIMSKVIYKLVNPCNESFFPYIDDKEYIIMLLGDMKDGCLKKTPDYWSQMCVTDDMIYQ